MDKFGELGEWMMSFALKIKTKWEGRSPLGSECGTKMDGNTRINVDILFEFIDIHSFIFGWQAEGRKDGIMGQKWGRCAISPFPFH